jgi:predicted transposase YbfD/YdcC
MDATLLSLHEALADVPDPRSRYGRYYSLRALLSLVSVALLAGQRSLEAIAQFGRDHGAPLAHALGFRSGRTPCKATLSNLLRRLDGAAFERVLLRWLHARCPDLGDRLALDGKTLRGTAGYEVLGAHLLTAYAPQVAAVVGQLRIDGKTNEHKAALELLGILPLRGKVVTGDAMFCHRDFCAKVLEGGGDYLLTVKDNQPQLHFDIASMFAESAAFSPLPTAALADAPPSRRDTAGSNDAP